MTTTTEDSGGAPAPQPEASTAVTTDQNADQVITTDDNGTPTMAPVTSSNDQPSEPAAEEESPAQAADKTDAEIAEWAEKKGLKINPENPTELKLARMQLETDRKFHEANQTKTPIEPPAVMPETGDATYDELIARQNIAEVKTYVRDWFDLNPDMKQYRQELTKIANDRPWLQNMDDVRAHFLANPERLSQLKNEGGRQALTNLAQKQGAVPPDANAVNSNVYESSQITPNNVYDLIDKNDQAWFQQNYAAINKAISGK